MPVERNPLAYNQFKMQNDRRVPYRVKSGLNVSL